MKVAILGSGSRGNAIAVTAEGSTLLIDAGFGIRTLQRRAQAVGIDLASVVAVLLTHEHGDHVRGATAVARKARCPIYASPGTLRALEATLTLDGATRALLPSRRPVTIGPFTVHACRTSHDAAEPLALAIHWRNPQLRVGVAYDLGRATAAVRNLLSGVCCLIVEANHDDHMLRTGPYPVVVQERIAGPSGHLSNREAAELIGELVHVGLQTVVLAHLSDICNRRELAADVVGAALRSQGFRGRMLIAEQDVPLGPFAVGAGATEQLQFDALN